jgi:hypothetical protein
MSQGDGELAWHGKTYNALKDKKHLTGINKEEGLNKDKQQTQPIWSRRDSMTINLARSVKK